MRGAISTYLSHRHAVNVCRSRDAILAVICSKVDEHEFANFFAEGRTMTVDQTIALALKELQ